MSATRRALDQYFTPASATRELLKHIDVDTKYVLECCSGDGAITRELKEHRAVVKTNDIDRALTADYYEDVADEQGWYPFPGGGHWVISNPPFNQAAQIIPLAYNYASVGIAMLLRLSFLEPCLDRDLWLAAHPPTKLIVLPRISFTGDGKTDNVTCAWMVWLKGTPKGGVVVVPREGRL